MIKKLNKKKQDENLEKKIRWLPVEKRSSVDPQRSFQSMAGADLIGERR